MYKIYLITNTINGKQYVGQTTQSVNSRMSQHKYEMRKGNINIILHNAIRKYGWNNFEVDILDECNTGEEANKLEIYYIGYYDTYNNGYNLTFGGEGVGSGENHPMYGKIPWNKGKLLSEETKIKISNSKKGKKNPEHSERMKGLYSGGNNPSAKPIILLHPDGKEEIFPCAKDACDEYNLNRGNLSMVLNGNRNNNKGFKAKFV